MIVGLILIQAVIQTLVNLPNVSKYNSIHVLMQVKAEHCQNKQCLFSWFDIASKMTRYFHYKVVHDIVVKYSNITEFNPSLVRKNVTRKEVYNPLMIRFPDQTREYRWQIGAICIGGYQPSRRQYTQHAH